MLRYAVMFLLLPLNAYAETVLFNINDINRCDGITDGTTLHMEACANAQLEKADMVLDHVYQSYIRSIEEYAKELGKSAAEEASISLHLNAVKQSRVAFEAYREEVSAVGFYTYYPGTASTFNGLTFSHDVTVQYIQHLLYACLPVGAELTDEFDTEKRDWCE